MFYAGIDAHVKSSTIWIVGRKGRKGWDVGPAED
jgi:hypothetical protein